METKNIIEVYKKRKYNEFLIEKRAKESEVTDEFKTLADKYNEDLLALLTEQHKENEYESYKINYTPTSKYAEETFKSIQKDFEDKMDERDRVVEEVTAQIEIAENRDQLIEIYKAYGILDNDGKIYDYK